MHTKVSNYSFDAVVSHCISERQTEYPFKSMQWKKIVVPFYMWPSTRKPGIMRRNHFWVKATIANYNLWTSAPANYLSLYKPVQSRRYTQKYTRIERIRVLRKRVTFIASGSPYTRRLSINVDHAHKIRTVTESFEREWWGTFRSKRNSGQAFPEIVSTLNQKKK